MPTTYQYPRYTCGNLQRPFRIGYKLGSVLSPYLRRSGINHLRQLITDIQMVIEPTLPQGCPFVIGGGLIRDAILGGRPSDIDVWLPCNLSMGDLGTYLPFVARRLPNYDWTVRLQVQGQITKGLT